MPPRSACAPGPESTAGLLSAYLSHLGRTGRGNAGYERGARTFLTRWPNVQSGADLPLRTRLSAGSQTRSFLTFLMVSRRLQPGYDYLVARKLSSFWRDLVGSQLEDDLRQFRVAANELGFSDRVTSAMASQVVARLLIQTGRRLAELRTPDFEELAQACQTREQLTGKGWWHYRMALGTTERVLFHLGVLTTRLQEADADPSTSVWPV